MLDFELTAPSEAILCSRVDPAREISPPPLGAQQQHSLELCLKKSWSSPADSCNLVGSSASMRGWLLGPQHQSASSQEPSAEPNEAGPNDSGKQQSSSEIEFASASWEDFVGEQLVDFRELLASQHESALEGVRQLEVQLKANLRRLRAERNDLLPALDGKEVDFSLGASASSGKASKTRTCSAEATSLAEDAPTSLPHTPEPEPAPDVKRSSSELVAEEREFTSIVPRVQLFDAQGEKREVTDDDMGVKGLVVPTSSLKHTMRDPKPKVSFDPSANDSVISCVTVETEVTNGSCATSMWSFITRDEDNRRGRRRSTITIADRIREAAGITTNKTKAIFADKEEMKRMVRLATSKPAYNVEDYYWESGWWQWLARHPMFESVTLFVIATNAIWIAIDTDFNDAETIDQAPLAFQVVENSYCLYFCIECFVRFMAFKHKVDCLQDGWFVFDSLLVSLMVLETWILPISLTVASSIGGSDASLRNASLLRLLRLLRLTRMGRMMRLLRAFPELMILIKGMGVAMRSVFCTLVLLVLFIYIFGVGFKMLAKDTRLEDQYFGSVLKAMTTLLLSGCMPDLVDIVKDLGEEHLLFGFLFGFFILLTTLTVMNMLVGVLCEVVSVVSSVEKEQMEVAFVKDKLQEMLRYCEGYQPDVDEKISKRSFQELLAIPQAAKALHQVGVDAAGLVDFTDFIFKGKPVMSFPDFMEVVLELRGTNKATVKDVVDLRKFTTAAFNVLGEKLASLESQIGKALGHGRKAGTWKEISPVTPPTSVQESKKGAARPQARRRKPRAPSDATDNEDNVLS